MLSPKPGVSTMVKAMRTPSSSSSVGGAVDEIPALEEKLGGGVSNVRTNICRLDFDALLDVGRFWDIGVLVIEDL